MATTGHENEAINVQGLKASLQKLKTDKIDPKANASDVNAALAGKQDKITASSKLSADFIADGTTNKVVTATEKSTWNGKADKATTIAGYGITDAYTKSETYTKTEVNGLVDTPHQEYVTVEATSSTTDAKDVLPASGQSADTIYRVSNWDGSANSGAGAFDATSYSEYAWDDVSDPNKYIFLCVKSQIGEVFDISVYNNNAKYADLAAALNGGANIPQSLQKGGMSVKFVQSYDNKYVQYFLTKDEWSIDLNDWLKVDAGLEKFYYINTEQQNGIEYNKYVNENGLLSTTAGFGSNKYEVEPGIYHFKTTMPENRAVSLWAAYKRNELVVKGSLTTVVREETFDLSFYDIDTIYISWTTETKGGAILTKINTAIVDNNNKLKNVFPQINDKTPSISTTYSSEKIGNDFVGLVTGKNIFNKDWAVLGAFIDITTNIIREQEDAWYCSEYIEIKPSQSYACNYNTYNNYFIFYDNNKNIISFASASTTSFVTPSNAAFLRITGFTQSQISTFQVEEGSASTPYVPYGKVIPPELLQSSIASFLFVDLKIVDKLGTYGFTSINSAVGAVQDGGVILVMPGEYEESVICQGKEVHIIGFSKDSCILFNTSGDYNNPPLYQTVGSLKNMTVWSKWDSSKDYSEITHFSFAIHIDYYGNNKKYSIENCHLISDFSNTLGCGARPNHCLTIKDCFVEHTNAYKEAFPSASTGGGNCMNMHGGGNETIILRDNVFISKTTDLQFGFGEGNTDVFKLLCVNNAIKTVVGLIAEHFDIQDRSYGNLNASLNYTT